IRVIGDRTCHYQSGRDPVFGDPAPFKSMSLRYELAYGGIDVYSDTKVLCPYGRNPLGRGFVVRNCQKAIDNLLLPNLEDPRDLLTPERLIVGECSNWQRQPTPQSFGWFPMCWLPRAALAGVMPAERAMHEQ